MKNQLRRQLINFFSRWLEQPSRARWMGLFNYTRSAVIDGHALKIPMRGGIGRELLDPPPAWIDQLCKKILALNEGAFFDVGCNFGQTFVLYLKHSKPGSRYLGVDALPECVSYVRSLAEKNEVSGFAVVATALSDETGFANLLCKAPSGPDSTISSLETNLRDGVSYDQVIAVPITTADALLQHLDLRPGFVKIDVEGFELPVLRGMSQTLRAVRPFVICEVMMSNHSEETARAARRQQIQETSELLKSLDYCILHARHNGTLQSLESLPLQDWKVEDGNDYDFLFVPQEKLKVFLES